MPDDGKILRYFDKSKLLDPNNPYKMQSILPITDDRYLERHPEAKYMSYHTATKKKYKDLASYVKKFRCKNCEQYGNMKAIGDSKNPKFIVGLICSNCQHIFHLDSPIDEENIAMDKRPELLGRATRMKQRLSESEKLGIDKASRKNSPQKISAKTFLLKDSSIVSTSADFSQIVKKSLKNTGYPVPVHTGLIKSVYDAEDLQFNAMMQGKSIMKERTVYNTNKLVDII